MRIFINPGHDLDIDPGACNFNLDIKECDIVREIGDRLQELLDIEGHETMLLQQDNLNGESGSYYESVCQQANTWDADIFVSIHCNSAENVLAQGTETLVYCFGGNSEVLATYIQDTIVEDLDTVDRGVKERPDLIVLKRTNMPAVLVELAFISNQYDAYDLITKKEEFAQAIFKGIKTYFA